MELRGPLSAALNHPLLCSCSAGLAFTLLDLAEVSPEASPEVLLHGGLAEVSQGKPPLGVLGAGDEPRKCGGVLLGWNPLPVECK